MILYVIILTFQCRPFDQFNVPNFLPLFYTRCQILRLKCTKIDFGWGSVPELTALPRLSSWNKGHLFTSKGRVAVQGKGRRRRERQGKGWRGRKGRGREGKGREWRGPCVYL